MGGGGGGKSSQGVGLGIGGRGGQAGQGGGQGMGGGGKLKSWWWSRIWGRAGAKVKSGWCSRNTGRDSPHLDRVLCQVSLQRGTGNPGPQPQGAPYMCLREPSRRSRRECGRRPRTAAPDLDWCGQGSAPADSGARNRQGVASQGQSTAGGGLHSGGRLADWTAELARQVCPARPECGRERVAQQGEDPACTRYRGSQLGVLCICAAHGQVMPHLGCSTAGRRCAARSELVRQRP